MKSQAEFLKAQKGEKELKEEMDVKQLGLQTVSVVFLSAAQILGRLFLDATNTCGTQV